MQDERTQRQVSKWLRSLIKVQLNFGACISSLNTFFTEHAKLKAPMRPVKAAAIRAPAQQNAFLHVSRDQDVLVEVISRGALAIVPISA